MKTKGRLFGIGVGPGDPQLLTLKAVSVLKEIPVVAVPFAARQTESLAYRITKEWINPWAEILRLPFEMVREKRLRDEQRRLAAEQISAFLLAGKDVAFLSEGDVMLFSTFSYILQHLQDDFEVHIIPGISSVMASAAQAALPLVVNDQNLAVLPAVESNIALLKELTGKFDTIVLMKVHLRIEEVKLVLEELGLFKQAVVVEKASCSDVRVFYDISKIRNGELSYMSQMIISSNLRGEG